MLDYIFSLLARQGKVWTESDHANKYMDGMYGHILLPFTTQQNLDLFEPIALADNTLTLSQTTNFKLFQTERVYKQIEIL